MAAIGRADIMKGTHPAAEKRKAVASKDWTVRELIRGYKAKKLVMLAKSMRICYTAPQARREQAGWPRGA
jgi:hypothetical protein